MVASRSPRAWSQRATTTARGMPTAAHSSHCATVAGSIAPSPPCWAKTSALEMTNSAASAARSPARSSPTKSP